MIYAILFWLAVAAFSACAVIFCAALLEGRQLSDEPRSHWPDGDQFPVTPDDFKPFHVD